MENLPINNGNGQSFGYTLYETTIDSSGVLSGLVRDRGQVGLSPLNSYDLVVIKPYNIPLPLPLPSANISGCYLCLEMALYHQLCSSFQPQLWVLISPPCLSNPLLSTYTHGVNSFFA